MAEHKYGFDLEYQERLLAAMIADHNFLRKNIDVLVPTYFDDETLVGLASALHTFVLREKSVPDRSALTVEVRDHVAPGRKLSEYERRLRRVWRRLGDNTDYYRRTAVDFARRQAMTDALRSSHQAVESGDIDRVLTDVQQAAKIGQSSSSESYDYFSSVRDRARDYRKGKTSSGTRVTTGIPAVDAITDGGLDRGELGLIAAPPGHGKTTVLVNLGAAAIMSGKSVLHVTLELSAKMISLKYDTRFFGGNLLEIRKKPKSFRRAIEAVKDKVESRLIVSEFPTRSLTVPKLRAVAGGIPNLGMIVVDFADLMKPVRAKEELRHELTEIYTSLRGVGGELGVPIWTASQANSMAVGARIIGMKNLAECFNKSGIVDFGMSICQTDAESADGRMRFFVFKSRIGKSEVQIECDVDWARCRIEPLDEPDVEDEAPVKKKREGSLE